MFYWLDQYTDALQQFIGTRLVLAPLLLLFVEEAGLPLLIPGDAVLAYTGYRVGGAHNGVTLVEAYLLAQIATLAGASVLFYLSRYWGPLLIDKLARFIFLKERHVHRAEALFARYGALGIIVGRHIPGLRIAVTIFAGIAGVRYITFIISTFVSSAIWIIVFLNLGRSIGANFHTHVQRYVTVSLAVMVAATLGVMLLHGIGTYRHKRHAQRRSGSGTQ